MKWEVSQKKQERGVVGGKKETLRCQKTKIKCLENQAKGKKYIQRNGTDVDMIETGRLIGWISREND